MRQNITEQVDTTFIFIVAVSFLLLLIVTITMIYFVVKYNKKRNPVADSSVSHNTRLEILWTSIPTVLVLVMFFFGYSGFKNMRNAPADAMTVKVTGRMWQWSFEYENEKKSDTLFVPVNKPIKMEITSLDVNHSFYLPDFRVKEDAVPGRINHLWFMPTEVRTYIIECAQYCGLSHSYMLSTISALPQEKFNEWYNNKSAVDSVKTDSTKTKLNPDTVKTK